MQRAPNHVPRWQLLGIWKSEMKIKVHWEQQSVRSFISNSTIAWRRLENHKSITRKRGMCDYRLLVPFRQLAVCVNTRKFLLAPAEMTQQGKARCWVFQCYVSCTENCAGAGWAYLDITWQTWHWTWPPGSLQSTFFLDWDLSGMSNSTNMDTRVLLLSTVLPPGYVLSSVVDSCLMCLLCCWCHWSLLTWWHCHRWLHWALLRWSPRRALRLTACYSSCPLSHCTLQLYTHCTLWRITCTNNTNTRENVIW